MLNVLFIEDEAESVETVIEELKEAFGNDVRCETKGFDDAQAALGDIAPDIVILDIFRGGATPEGNRDGLKVYEIIWEKCFCPIVVYSARPDLVSAEIAADHPFIRSVQKGSNSECKVLSYVREFQPHVEALASVHVSVREHMNRELRDVAPMVFRMISDPTQRRDVFVRASRRRIAAMVDTPTTGTIAPWEQYLYPPIGSDLLTGDVLRKVNGEAGKAEDYCVVLTPSCDLARRAGRERKVEVLVARCSAIGAILPEARLERGAKADAFKRKLVPILTRGYGTSCLPLPELPGILPPMAVCLKQLEVIASDLVGEGKGCKYCRVVSVDSPFRELISWAYLQVAGRPGLPDRDFEAWASDIRSVIRKEDGEP